MRYSVDMLRLPLLCNPLTANRVPSCIRTRRALMRLFMKMTSTHYRKGRLCIRRGLRNG